MFAVIAAFGLATATLVIPLVHQAYAQAPQSRCHDVDIGTHVGIG
jgi:hypothetical protein